MLRRIDRARDALRDEGIDALLVGPSADLRYLVGHHAPPLERLTLLVVPTGAPAVLVVPRLEEPLARAAGADAHAHVRAYDETEDPVELVVDVLRAVGATGRLAVQDRLWSTFTIALQDALPGASWSTGSPVMRRLRTIKSAEEIAALRRVGAAIDEVHARVPELLVTGRTEAEVARDLERLIREGHDTVNFVIVASGPNAASPHHHPAGRVLQEGDAVLVDIGGTLEGYCSDVTRDYAVGRLPEGYAEIHDVLERAQEAAVAAVAPGVPAERIDAAARDVIAAAGHAEHFIHRTGHGIGIEEHEDPWIVAGNREPLAPGMAFSVEPGIYLPGRFGARIEDIVVVTDDGVERLNHRPRTVVVA